MKTHIEAITLGGEWIRIPIKLVQEIDAQKEIEALRRKKEEEDWENHGQWQQTDLTELTDF